MPTTVTVFSVGTSDADPDNAPHKISNQSGEDFANVVFFPFVSDNSDVKAWRIVFNSPLRNAGLIAGKRGMVCGLDRCGEPTAYPTSIPDGTEIDEDVTYSETGGPADGDYTVRVWAASELGWNAQS